MPSGRKPGGHSEYAGTRAALCEEHSSGTCRLPGVKHPQIHQHISGRACAFEFFYPGIKLDTHLDAQNCDAHLYVKETKQMSSMSP